MWTLQKITIQSNWALSTEQRATKPMYSKWFYSKERHTSRKITTGIQLGSLDDSTFSPKPKKGINDKCTNLRASFTISVSTILGHIYVISQFSNFPPYLENLYGREGIHSILNMACKSITKSTYRICLDSLKSSIRDFPPIRRSNDI